MTLIDNLTMTIFAQKREMLDIWIELYNQLISTFYKIKMAIISFYYTRTTELQTVLIDKI